MRLAVYELTKLIAPNNVSVVRMRDYEDSMKWLNDAAKLPLWNHIAFSVKQVTIVAVVLLHLKQILRKHIDT